MYRVAVFVGGSLGCYFDSLDSFVVSEINVNGCYIVGYRICVTLVTAKKNSCDARDVISLPPELGHCTPSSF